jgi:hypothetical protein
MEAVVLKGTLGLEPEAGTAVGEQRLPGAKRFNREP